MVRLISLFLFTTVFLGVQSYAAVCEVKCDLQSPRSINISQTSEASSMPCHSSSASKKTKSPSEQDSCGDLCQTEDFPVVDVDLLTYFNTDIQLVFSFSSETFLEENTAVAKVIFKSGDASSGPPTFGFFNKATIFIQKSSYLI